MTQVNMFGNMANSRKNKPQNSEDIMQRFSHKILASLIVVFASVSHAATPASFPCNSKDIKAIDTASKIYFKDHSAFALNDLTVAAPRCVSNHASANIRLKKYAAIQTNVYLKKVDSKWQVLMLGSKFNQQLAADIPKTLRDATEVSVKA
jgi:hypothetical protein